METRVLTLFDDDDFLPKKDSGKKPSKKIAAVAERVETQSDAGNKENQELQSKPDTNSDSVTAPATSEIDAAAEETVPEVLDRDKEDVPNPDTVDHNAGKDDVSAPPGREPAASLSLPEEMEETAIEDTIHLAEPQEFDTSDEPVYMYEAVDIITEDVYADIQEADELLVADEKDDDTLQPAEDDVDSYVENEPVEISRTPGETAQQDDADKNADDELSRQMISELIQLDYTALLHRDFPAAPVVQKDKEIKLHLVNPEAVSEEASVEERTQVETGNSATDDDREASVPDMPAEAPAEAETKAEREMPQQQQEVAQDGGSESTESLAEESGRQAHSDILLSERLSDENADTKSMDALAANNLSSQGAAVETPATAPKDQVDEVIQETVGTDITAPEEDIPTDAQSDAAKASEEAADPLPEWKLEKKYYAIGEVAALFGVNTSHIRFWTNEFKLRPRTTRKGDRLYNTSDIAQLRLIHHLVKEKKHTIKGAKEKLKAEKDKVNNKLDLKHSLTQLRDLLVHIRNQI